MDTFIRLPMLKIMSHKADQGGAPAYAYVFTWENGGIGSNHGAEIPFVFVNLTGGDDAAQKLAETVSQAWINFAKTGTPSARKILTGIRSLGAQKLTLKLHLNTKRLKVSVLKV